MILVTVILVAMNLVAMVMVRRMLILSVLEKQRVSNGHHVMKIRHVVIWHVLI